MNDRKEIAAANAARAAVANLLFAADCRHKALAARAAVRDLLAA
jgi:hypothetical protein